MRSLIRALAGIGVASDQTPAEQRRIRTVNVVALFAFSATGFLSILFLPSRPASVSLWEWSALLVFYLSGYIATLVLNRLGRHDLAVVVLLTAGLVNMVGASLTVGFQAGPAVFLVTAAIGAILVTRAEQRATRWLFVTLTALAYTILVVVDAPIIESIAGTWFESVLVAVSYVVMIGFVVTVVWYQRNLADRAEDALSEANERSERLLLNILPSDIAERLKTGESPIADRKPAVTVLFADIVGSTPISEELSANDLVATLDGLFSSFDDIANQYGLEKIKTVGDNYFAVAGLPSDNESHVQSAAEAALAMRDELVHHYFPGIGQVHMRFGLHTGPVVAGVIGKRKFSYDVWGDTVNTASRMESTSEKDMIQVSQQVYNHLKGQYDLESRGNVSAKGKGNLATYELISRRTPPDSQPDSSRP